MFIQNPITLILFLNKKALLQRYLRQKHLSAVRLSYHKTVETV